jgi:hypothetical protein
VVRVVVNHDGIGIPEPVRDICIIKRGNTEIEAAEPEALPVATLKVIYVTGPEPTVEAAVLEWMVQVESWIVWSKIMSGPPAIMMYVRSFRMAFHIPMLSMFGHGSGGGVHGRRTTRRDVPAAKTTTSVFAALLSVTGSEKQHQ